MRRLLAATLLAAAVGTFAQPAMATPCVGHAAVGDVCVLNLGPSLRGAAVVVYGVEYVVTGGGCYYPGGSPRYYVFVGSGTTGLVHVDAPVGGVPCV